MSANVLPSGQVVIWLEDEPRPDWVEEETRSLAPLGIEVRIAKGFRRLTQFLEEHKDCPSKVAVIILDIMIDGVADISQFFPWVVDGTTSHGFAAGLVFLERVLSPESRSKEDDLFGAFDGVPVILYSIRRIGPSEQKRVHLIRRRRKAALRVLVKQGDNELFNTINALVARSKENTK